MIIGFTGILAIIVILMFAAAIFAAVYGIIKRKPALAVISAVSFVVFVAVVYAALTEFISRM